MLVVGGSGWATWPTASSLLRCATGIERLRKNLADSARNIFRNLYQMLFYHDYYDPGEASSDAHPRVMRPPNGRVEEGGREGSLIAHLGLLRSLLAPPAIHAPLSGIHCYLKLTEVPLLL